MPWIVQSPERLIDFLKIRAANSFSNKALRRALDRNACRVNGKIERFASRNLKAGDQVSFSLSSLEEKTSWNFPILFEDEWLQVIDKPAGWVCEEASLHRFLGSKVQLVHRLDKETSGVLLLAKTAQIKAELMELFAKREMKKVYLALADGACSWRSLVKESQLVRKKTFAGQTIWGSAPSRGLYARTEIEAIAVGKEATLFACYPETGRTHQIRVHLAELGHPILIDRQYAATFRSPYTFARPLLQALYLAFSHPVTGKEVSFSAPLPRDMRSAIDLVGFSSGHVGQFLMKYTQEESRSQAHEDEETKKIV